MYKFYLNIDGLVQGCSISSALAMEILQSCTKSSIYDEYGPRQWQLPHKAQQLVSINYILCIFYYEFSHSPAVNKNTNEPALQY